MMFLIVLVSLIFSSSVNAKCDNDCSGHGYCLVDDVCMCYSNWGNGLGNDSGDCSDRKCPYEIAWTDTPNSYGHFHNYAECSARGTCNQETGECDCYTGYTGKACQRSTCPNDCSGHGTCEYIEDLSYGEVYADYSPMYFETEAKQFSYYDWDSRKIRACVCDALYGDVDCSKRLCERGTDPLDVRDNLLLDGKYQTQMIKFRASEGNCANDGKTFALQFKSLLNETFNTIPIVFKCQPDEMHDFVLDVKHALETLPNQVIDGVSVSSQVGPSISTSGTDISGYIFLNITFKGCAVEGPQFLLTVLADECNDGCSPKITGLEMNNFVENVHYSASNISEIVKSDYNSYECSRRGKCDYDTGICGCFHGYGGNSCNVQVQIS